MSDVFVGIYKKKSQEVSEVGAILSSLLLKVFGNFCT